MLSAEGCKQRQSRLWASFSEPPDWIILSDPKHLIYFANFYLSPFVFRTQDAAGLLLLGKGGEAVLVVDNVVEPLADRGAVTEVVAPVWYRCVEPTKYRHAHLVEHAVERTRGTRATRIGIGPSTLPVGFVDALRRDPSIEFVDVEPVVERMRRVKDEDEVAVLRQAIRAGEAGLRAAVASARPGMTELDVFLRMQQAALETLGGQAILYGDFSSGPNANSGGGRPTQRKIEPGDALLLDYSVLVHGYRGDFTNTFLCGGKPSDQQRDMETACLEAMRAGEAMLRPGVRGRDVDTAVRSVFRARGLEKFFPHHSGHGIGLGHPEAPYLIPESDEVLEAGNVVTLEPGLYVSEGPGMRFEHNYLITQSGFERLTHHPLGLEVTAS